MARVFWRGFGGLRSARKGSRNVTKDDTEIGSVLRQQLIDKVGIERFELWLGDHVRFEYSEGTLRVYVPDSFTLERLRTKMYSEIESAATAAVGKCPEIRFEIRNFATSNFYHFIILYPFIL